MSSSPPLIIDKVSDDSPPPDTVLVEPNELEPASPTPSEPIPSPERGFRKISDLGHTSIPSSQEAPLAPTTKPYHEPDADLPTASPSNVSAEPSLPPIRNLTSSGTSPLPTTSTSSPPLKPTSTSSPPLKPTSTNRLAPRPSTSSSSSSASSLSIQPSRPNSHGPDQPSPSLLEGPTDKSKSRKSRQVGKLGKEREPLEEDWSRTEFGQVDEPGRIISEEMIRASSIASSSEVSVKSLEGKQQKKKKEKEKKKNGSFSGEKGIEQQKSERTGGGGGGGRKFVQSLRRTRSKLGLMGSGNGGNGGGGGEGNSVSKPLSISSSSNTNRERGMEQEEEEDGMMVQSPVLTFVEPPSPSESRTFSQNFDQIHDDDTRLSTSPTTSPFFSSSSATSPNSPSSTTTATQRIGGWFSSILTNSTNPSSALPPPPSTSSTSTPSSPNTSPTKERPRQRGSSHSPSSTKPFFSTSSTTSSTSSPTKKLSNSSLSLPPPNSTSSGGLTTSISRLGPLDRMLDKAVQYFLDTDSNVDKCPDDIWLFGGVRHDGWREGNGGGGGEELERLGSGGGEGLGSGAKKGENGRRWSPVKLRATRERQERQRKETVEREQKNHSRDRSPSPSVRSFSTTRSGDSIPTISSVNVESSQETPATINGWPSSFYQDFYSRPALTYRTNFPFIPCTPSSSPTTSTGARTTMNGMFNSLSLSIGRGGGGGNGGGAARGGGDENGLNSDTGWGCMLRTGQSLLANALVTAHLGRDWRRPLPPSALPSPSPHGQPAMPLSSSVTLPSNYATYTRILSLFLDTPSPASPFSIHKFALEGQRLGKSVGEWFGPSTAAGAIKKLVNDYEPAGIKVVSCVDGTLYENEVVAAGTKEKKWEDKVLVLINLRLGIDGVNPIYHEAIKGIFRVPQSVGIAGGRPSSSYYFVGSQANSLFYIDPHHPRPAVPSIDVPSELQSPASRIPLASMSSSRKLDLDIAAKGEVDEEIEMLNSFFSTAYDDSAWRTYHCDKVRKCSLSSLDPSMLVGFLIQDEEDWEDFKSKARELGQTSSAIFSIAPSPPKWMRRSSSAAPPPPTAGLMSVSPGEDSFSEIDEDTIINRSATTARGGSGAQDGGVEAFEEDEVDFSEPEGWELDSTDASETNSIGEVVPSPVDSRAEAAHSDEEESDPVFVDSRTSLRSRESTRDTKST